MKKLVFAILVSMLCGYAHADEVAADKNKLQTDRDVRNMDQKTVQQDKAKIAEDLKTGAGNDQLKADRAKLRADRKMRNKAQHQVNKDKRDLRKDVREVKKEQH